MLETFMYIWILTLKSNYKNVTQGICSRKLKFSIIWKIGILVRIFPIFFHSIQLFYRKVKS